MDEHKEYENLMEKSLEQAVDHALISPDVDGVCVIDQNGFCISAKGTISAEGSSVYKEVATLAAKLEPGKRMPSVTFISENNEKIFIQEKDGIVVALNIKNN